MTVCTDIHAHSISGRLGGASSPGELVADTPRASMATLTAETVIIRVVPASRMDHADRSIGWRCGGTAATLVVTVSANLDEAISTDLTPKSQPAVPLATVFAVNPDTALRHLTGGDVIHGTTSTNEIFTVICPFAGKYRIHGSTCENDTDDFAAPRLIRVPNAGSSGPNNGGSCKIATAVLATTASANFDEATAANLTPLDWRTVPLATVFAVSRDAIDSGSKGDRRWRIARTRR